jgi:hypothetical protein
LDSDILNHLVAQAPVPYGYFCTDTQRARQGLDDLLWAEVEGGNLQSWDASDTDNSVFIAATSLQWDTQQLGFGCGQLKWVLYSGPEEGAPSLLASLGGAVKSWCETQNIDLLACKVSRDRLPLVHGLQAWGMRLVDCELLWVADAGRRPPASPPIAGVAIEYGQGVEIERIGDLAQVFELDRFHADYRIDNTKASALWAQSLYNACSGRADQVVIALGG